MDSAGVRLTQGSVALATLAELHGGTVDDEATGLVVHRVAPLEGAVAGDLCPLTSRRHLDLALASSAALLVSQDLAPLVPRGRRWVHAHASFALAALLADLERTSAFSTADAIHGSLVSPRDARVHIDPRAEVADDVEVGPFAVIMGFAVVGRGSVIGPHAVVYPRVRIGSNVMVGASAVIGRPGFGWAEGPNGESRRIPQLGGVSIEDDVEVGPLCTIDAGTLGPTILRRGTRLDAHVHVGHNARLGPDVIVAAQSGFAGSVVVEAGVRIGGQVGIADHVHVGRGARIAAKSGVIGDVAAYDTVAGYPAVSRLRWLRGMARLLRRDDRGK